MPLPGRGDWAAQRVEQRQRQPQPDKPPEAEAAQRATPRRFGGHYRRTVVDLGVRIPLLAALVHGAARNSAPMPKAPDLKESHGGPEIGLESNGKGLVGDANTSC